MDHGQSLVLDLTLTVVHHTHLYLIALPIHLVSELILVTVILLEIQSVYNVHHLMVRNQKTVLI